MNATRTYSGALALAGALVLLGPGAALAAPINYGDFVGSSVMYIDVTETANTPGDAEPLFGGPSISGNALDFDPAGFSALATDGSSDLTDGQLNFTMMALQGATIETVTFSERGDYSLLGTGTAATLVNYAVSVGSISVLEVDGVALAAPVSLSGASASGGDNLGNGSDSLTPWSLSLTYDVNAALAAVGVPFRSGATKLELAIDDALAAISEPDSIAFIAKKDFRISATSDWIKVPEPATLTLLLLAALGLSRGRRGGA